MSAATAIEHHQNDNGSEVIRIRDGLVIALYGHNIRLIDTSLWRFRDWEVKTRSVMFVKNRYGEPFCLIGKNCEGVLLGNFVPRELPMRMTSFRSAGISIDPILHCGAFNGIRVHYMGEEIALAVDAAFLLERLKLTR